MNLTEAFKALNALNEETFSVSDDGIEKLSQFEDNDDLDDTLSIIDTEAETEEDLQDSYLGKVILDCCVCHSKLYKDKDDIKIDDEGSTFTEEKVIISLSENDWTYGPISADLSFSEIPNGYEMEYKVGTGKWTTGKTVTNITRNGTISARLYNKDSYSEIALNTKDITNIDREKPTITQVINSE